MKTISEELRGVNEMSKQLNNIMAFPVGFHPEGNSADQQGMNLRDYFQAHALSCIKIASDSIGLGGEEELKEIANQIATLTGMIADAMLEERERRAR